MTTLKTHSLILALAVAAAGACTTEGDPIDDTDNIESQLELDDGGFDEADELPAFGMEDVFTEAGELDVDVTVTDELETDADVAAMMEAPDAAVYRVGIVWGQLPRDPDAREDGETPRNWSGTIRINRGAMLVRSTIRFEGPTDALLPRTSPRAVSFTSATLPGHDGLRLAIIDPEPFADTPLVISYETADGELYATPVAALLDGPVVVDVDDLGNRVAGVAMRRPVDVCEHGFLGGRWHKVGPHFGIFIGRVTSARGELKGHMRGIYGVRRSGEKVFFGKYIGRGGESRGLFKGHYDEGHFAGRWLSRGGERGRLGGHYRESIPGPRTGGHFLGRWAETTCDIEVGPGTDVPGE